MAEQQRITLDPRNDEISCTRRSSVPMDIFKWSKIDDPDYWFGAGNQQSTPAFSCEVRSTGSRGVKKAFSVDLVAYNERTFKRMESTVVQKGNDMERVERVRLQATSCTISGHSVICDVDL